MGIMCFFCSSVHKGHQWEERAPTVQGHRTQT
jgi:hypothetical protein